MFILKLTIIVTTESQPYYDMIVDEAILFRNIHPGAL